ARRGRDEGETRARRGRDEGEFKQIGRVKLRITI
ncbi:Protein of unknown function, partial [Gryllus bimaculatus]